MEQIITMTDIPPTGNYNFAASQPGGDYPEDIPIHEKGLDYIDSVGFMEFCVS